MKPSPSSCSTRQGYGIAAACFTIQAVGIGTFVSYGVFFNSLMTELQWSRAVISGASSLSFFLSGLFAIFVGRLSDLYGPKNLMRVTALFFGAGFMLMSQVESLWQLYLFYGLFFGIGLSSIDVIALTTTARWFVRRRGLMTGLVKVGTGAGQFSIPLAASLLIAAYGWRQAYLYIGAAALVLLFGVANVLKRDPITLQNQEDVPGGIITPPSKTEARGIKTNEAIKTVQLWTICSAYLLIVFCLLTVLVHIVPHARDIGLSPTKAAGVLSTIGGVSMVGRFITGITIDRIGSKSIMLICIVILITSLIWLQFADSLWMLYLFASVYGFAHGGFFTAISPIAAEVFGIAAHGSIFGIIVFFGTTGGAIGPILAGQLFDTTGSYATTFKMITVLSIVGMGLVLSLRPIK